MEDKKYVCYGYPVRKAHKQYICGGYNELAKTPKYKKGNATFDSNSAS